ncbi:lipoprotein [Anaerorhabdus sp.]|uniref:lipoprotein n=1 Tax=Anaerorhabdus sp. TaxID=1872524 RepID=UPI002FC84DCE
MKKYIYFIIFLLLLSGCSTSSEPTVEPPTDPTLMPSTEPSIEPTDIPKDLVNDIDLTLYKEEALFEGKLHYYVKDPLPEDVIVVFNPELISDTDLGTVARILVYTEKPFSIWIEDYWIVTDKTEGLNIIYEENGYYVMKHNLPDFYGSEIHDSDEEKSIALETKEKYTGTVIFTNK